MTEASGWYLLGGVTLVSELMLPELPLIEPQSATSGPVNIRLGSISSQLPGAVEAQRGCVAAMSGLSGRGETSNFFKKFLDRVAARTHKIKWRANHEGPLSRERYRGQHRKDGPHTTTPASPGSPRHRTEAREIQVESVRKESVAVIFGEPETTRFLAAVQRLKREQRKRERLTRQAKQRVRQALRKMRAC